MKVTFVSFAGEARTIEAAGGLSLVEVALEHGVEGIDAECGGACSCATCHVLVADAWRGKVGDPRIAEDDMLQILEEDRRPNSRLACQIVLSEELDGLEVHLPEKQID